MDDTQIIELYLARSETAIEQSAKKYGPYLKQIAYQILRDHEDVDEVVQDTYLGAWNTIPPQIPKVLKHYLSRIVRNLAFNRLDYRTAKRRDPHIILILSELDACLPDKNSDLESTMERKQIGQCINRFLSNLGKTDCAVFLCRYYHCMTIREISTKYCLTERNVKYRLSVLRQKLRKQLDKEGICI